MEFEGRNYCDIESNDWLYQAGCKRGAWKGERERLRNLVVACKGSGSYSRANKLLQSLAGD